MTAAAQLRVRFASQRGYELWDARARQEAGRALLLDPDLAEAHVALAAVHRFQGYDWDTVIHESRRALELNPSLDTPHLTLAAAYFHLGLQSRHRVRAARRAGGGGPLALTGGEDRVFLLSLVRARPAARSHSRAFRVRPLHAGAPALVGGCSGDVRPRVGCRGALVSPRRRRRGQSLRVFSRSRWRQRRGAGSKPSC